MGNKARLKTIFKITTGKDINISNFDGRMYAQKVIEFIKEAGLKFDYNFSWYIRGPYSSVLADDLYAIDSDKNGTIQEIALPQRDTVIIDKILSSFKEEISDVNTMELFASLVFCMKNEKLNDTELADKMVSLKPWFTKGDVLKAIKKIRESSLFNV